MPHMAFSMATEACAVDKMRSWAALAGDWLSCAPAASVSVLRTSRLLLSRRASSRCVPESSEGCAGAGAPPALGACVTDMCESRCASDRREGATRETRHGPSQRGGTQTTSAPPSTSPSDHGGSAFWCCPFLEPEDVPSFCSEGHSAEEGALREAPQAHSDSALPRLAPEDKPAPEESLSQLLSRSAPASRSGGFLAQTMAEFWASRAPREKEAGDEAEKKEAEDVGLPPLAQWESLPADVLREVAAKLPWRSRRAMCGACRTWERALASATLGAWPTTLGPAVEVGSPPLPLSPPATLAARFPALRRLDCSGVDLEVFLAGEAGPALHASLHPDSPRRLVAPRESDRCGSLRLRSGLRDAQLRALGSCARLEALGLRSCDRLSAEALGEALSRLPALTHLDLGGWAPGRLGPAHLAAVASRAPRLQVLVLGSCCRLADLAPLAPLRALHTLELQGLASAAPLAGLGDLLPGLRSVVLAACDLGSDDVLALMRSPGLDSVLVLRCPRVSRAALRSGGCVAGADSPRRPRSVWRT